MKSVNGASRRANFGIFFSAMRDPKDFLPRLVAMEETWLYYYDPETKQHSMEWRYDGSPAPNTECKNPLERFSPRFFGMDQDGILLIDYLPKGQTINTEYYSSLLVQLKDILKEKRRGKLTKAVLFFARRCPVSPGTCNPEETGLPGFPVS